MANTELALLIDRFMRRIHFSLQSRADAFDTENVGPGGGIVLMTIADLGQVTQHELTQRVARDKSQMTRMIKSLETKGLIVKTPSPEDGRVSIVSLTDKGAGVVEDLRAAVAEAINAILAPIDADQRMSLTNLMKQIAFSDRN